MLPQLTLKHNESADRKSPKIFMACSWQTQAEKAAQFSALALYQRGALSGRNGFAPLTANAAELKHLIGKSGQILFQPFQIHAPKAHMTYLARYSSPLGELTLVCNDFSLEGLWLESQDHLPCANLETAKTSSAMRVFRLAAQWLDAYFGGKRPDIKAVPLAPQGSPFRQLIWKILCDIPYGQCASYGDIARQAAGIMHRQQMSSRAVGGAVGHNPISIIIPCHRVMGAHGNLTGYGGGIAAKLRLLQLEGVDTSRFSLPRSGKYATK